jgi:hypothetical protein
MEPDSAPVRRALNVRQALWPDRDLPPQGWHRIVAQAGRVARLAGILWAALLILATPPAVLYMSYQTAEMAERVEAGHGDASGGFGVAEEAQRLRARSGTLTLIGIGLVCMLLASGIAWLWGMLAAEKRRRRQSRL